jgi:hypothetical protein
MLRAFILLLFSVPALAQTPDEINALLTNRIDVGKQAVGLVVGIIDADGRQVLGTAASLPAILGNSTAKLSLKSDRSPKSSPHSCSPTWSNAEKSNWTTPLQSVSRSR